jgi:hypothetical protein
MEIKLNDNTENERQHEEWRRQKQISLGVITLKIESSLHT